MDFSRPQQIETLGDSVSSNIGSEVLAQLRAVAQENNTTMFVLLQALFSILVSKYSRSKDIVLGAPIANRDERGLSNAVGLFLNNVVLRNYIDDTQKFDEFIAQISSNMTQVMSHQHVPFEQVVDVVNPPRHIGIHPLFQIMINHQKRGEGENFYSDDGVKLSIVGQDASAAKYDLTAYFVETPDAMKVTFNFQTSLFAKSRIEHLLGDFLFLLTEINSIKHRLIGDIKLVGKYSPVIAEGEVASIDDKPILSIIREHCLNNYSENTILSDDNISLTGSALWNSVLSSSEDLLTEFNILPGDVIAITDVKDINYIIHLLAINLIGAIAVPLGLDIPEQRMEVIISTAKIKLVIGPWRHNESSILQVDKLNKNRVLLKEIKPFNFGKNHPMYLIFTSGSTGLPKGVMGTEYGLINRCRWMQDTFKLADNETSIHLTEMGYIRAMWELYLPLLQGQAVRLVAGNYFKDLVGFSLQLVDLGIQRIVTAPSILKAILQHDDIKVAARFNQLQYWFVSGETFPFNLIRKIKLLLPNVSIINLYGSTEVTSDVSYSVIDDVSEYLTVGLPINNTQLMVVNEKEQPQQPLVVGEVVVAGAGVALGYINDPERMAKAFGQMLCSSDDIIYKTGDLGYFSVAGNLILLGREDDQISIRGYRVELGEIEAAVSQLDFVREFTLLAIPHTEDGYRIVVFLCSSAQWINNIQSAEYYQALSDARETLGKQLPHYMLPNQFVVVDKIPMRSNGKIDRDALLDYLHKENTNNELTFPSSNTERRLSYIWQDILKIKTIALDDMFFDVGGNSLLATQVINRIEEEFGISVPLKQVFTHPTLRWLSQSIENALFITSLETERDVDEEYEEFEL